MPGDGEILRWRNAIAREFYIPNHAAYLKTYWTDIVGYYMKFLAEILIFLNIAVI